MVVQTQYGLCNNVDLEHMKPYLGGIGGDTDCICFTDYILDVPDSEAYLLFYFEVWKDKGDEFHFLVEEGFEDGSAETYTTELSKGDQEEIKKLYYEFIKRR